MRIPRTRVFLGSLGALLMMSGTARAVYEIGIDRSKLSQQSESEQQVTLKDIQSLHAVWFRDGLTSGSPQALTNFVNEVRLVKQNNLKMLANITQMDSDYDGRLPLNRCGWNEKKLSRINLDKFGQRLRTIFGALKAAGLSIDAVEFGNEDDQYCYDADVPNGHVATPEEIHVWLQGYGRFLKTGADILHDPQYYPQAKIITFGMAHSGDPLHSFSNPASVVAQLKNVDGVDYIDNETYKVDGYGTHIYPSPNDLAVAGHFLRQDAQALGHEKRFWVTEWGFLDIKNFPNRKGQSLSQCIHLLLGTLVEAGLKIPLGPLMFYSYNGWLANPPGHLLAQAQVLSDYAGKH